MLRLKESVRNFISSVAINPEKEIKAIEEYVNNPNVLFPAKWFFDSHETKNNIEFELILHMGLLEEIKQLEPYVWYPRSQFDGNPREFFLLELEDKSDNLWSSKDSAKELFSDTKLFMYIVPPKGAQNEQDA